MVLGLLPAIRGGLGELAKTGQHSRLIEGYLKRYAQAFAEVRYFSYLDESLDDYTDDLELRAKVRLFPGGGWHPWLYAFWMPFRYWRQFRSCTVFRVFQVTGVIPALLAKRLFGIPFVTTYGFWYSKLARSRATARLRRVVEAAGLASADAVIVPTPELAAHVAGRVKAAKIHVIPNGVETSLFRPAPRAPGPVKHVLYVGRLSAEKNLGALLEAAGKLVNRFDLRVIFIGDGPLGPSLRDQARRLRVPVEFLQVVDHRKLPGYFVAADAFVLPSFTEGHPKVLLEAMSCGVPCVASDVGGNRAILRDGETGLLFDPQDPNALAERIERIFVEEEFGQRLGERARAHVVERYDLGALVGQEIGLLRRVAQAAPKTATRTETVEEACVLCGSRIADRLFAARDRLHNLPGEFWIVRCADCGLLRTSPRPSPEALAAYYPEDYAPHRDSGEEAPMAEASARGWSALWSRLRRRVASRRIWWTPSLPPGAHVLELGSGAGHFVRHALAHEWEVHALEPAAGPAQRLGRDPRVRLHREAAEAMVFPPDSLDAVFAWMVVEHLENPAAVLRKISAALKPGGYFVFSVPNAGSWEFGVFRERWYGLDIPRHLWHFTPRTLRRLLDACGLSVQRVFHQKVLKNIGGSLEHVSGDFPLLAPLTRGLARAISWPLVSFAIGAALAGFRQGGRLTVVARKPR